MPLEPSSDPTDDTVTSSHISVIGTGYVGLVTALAFAHHGHSVTCVDVIQERVDGISRGTLCRRKCSGMPRPTRKDTKIS